MAKDKPNFNLQKLLTSKSAVLVAVITGTFTIIVAMFSPFFTELAKNLVPRMLPTPTAISSPSSSSTTTLSSTITTPPCIVASSPRYGFECGLSGWDKTDYFETSQAIEAVTTIQKDRDNVTTTVSAITVDFTGSKPDRKTQYRESGEVQVNLNSNPPAGNGTKVVDLTGKVVTAWIWASSGSIGDIGHKNGVQLFIKDDKDRNCYGKWNNIEKEDTWFRISWSIADAQICDAGFDSTRPKILGLKIALGKDTIAVYDKFLTIYLDNVDW